ncbi:MAG: hypothetical protein WCH39_02920 [Schlesneria sp.]
MQNQNPPHDETLIEQLELSFLAASGSAFLNAYQQAVVAGLSVVVSEEGKIFEIFPDGQRKLLKEIEPPSPSQPGQRYTIQ